jgi:hypothetical protein
VKVQLTALGIILGLASTGQAALVWESTFDTNADGVVQIRADNPNGAVMIGANSGGVQAINTQGVSTTLSNKAGRPTADNGGPASLGANDSFSALYTFNWSFPNDPTNTGIEFQAVVTSPTSPHNSRQHIGAKFVRQVVANGDNLVNLAGTWASEGFVGAGRNFAGDVNLGPNLDGRPLQLAYGYDGNALNVALYDGVTGALLSQAGPLDIELFDNLGAAPGSGPLNNELANLSVSHVGWSDGNNAASNTDTIWNMDSLRFYDDASGAFADVIPEPASGMLLLAAVAMMHRRRRA